eukprot:6219916-Pyramimonas_sp.AAC.1
MRRRSERGTQSPRSLSQVQPMGTGGTQSPRPSNHAQPMGTGGTQSPNSRKGPSAPHTLLQSSCCD